MFRKVVMLLSICRFVRNLYCGKTAEWIRMSFRMMSGVGRGIGVLYGGDDHRRGRGSFGVNFARLTVSNGAFVVYRTSATMREPIELCLAW